MGKIENIRKKGIRIRVWNIILIIAAGIASILLMCSVLRIKEQYDKTVRTEKIYKGSCLFARQLQNGSDNLTKQAQHFAVTGDQQYLEAYFAEKNSRRRENALSILMEMEVSEEAKEMIDLAMKESLELMDMEYNSMKMVVVAEDIPQEELPDDVKNYDLKNNELNMESQKLMELAQDKVFGETYQIKKESIDMYIRQFTDSITNENLENMRKNSQQMDRMITQQVIGMVTLILIMLIIFYIWYTQITVVMEKYVINLLSGEPLPEKGVYELRCLAAACNEAGKKETD